jgi:hypothetical protein
MIGTGRIARTAETIGSTAMKFLGKHVGNVKTLGNSLIGGNLRDPRVMQKVATASLSLYMGVNVATYGARMASGRSPFKNRKGQRNIFIGTPI